MTAQSIDGTAVARKVREDVARGVEKLVAGGGAPPGLATVLIGDDEGCQEAHDVSLLIRTATNTYFPQVATVISLPEAESELGRLVQAARRA